jgi:hypothetical protein
VAELLQIDTFQHIEHLRQQRPLTPWAASIHFVLLIARPAARRCTTTDCDLHPYRDGKGNKKLSPEQRQRNAERLREARWGKAGAEMMLVSAFFREKPHVAGGSAGESDVALADYGRKQVALHGVLM